MGTCEHGLHEYPYHPHAALIVYSYGLLTLTEQEYTVVREGKPDPARPIALIGAGTGLGECFLARDGDRYRAYPSEGGHVEYPAGTPLELELLRFLQSKFGRDGEPGRISAERIVSGKGIENVYSFLVKRFPEKVGRRLLGSSLHVCQG